MVVVFVASACGRSWPYDNLNEGSERGNLVVHNLCRLPLGTKEQVHLESSDTLSPLALCDEGFAGGFRQVTGRGSRDIAGYPTADCGQPIPVPGIHTAFWRQTQQQLDARAISHGTVARVSCDDAPTSELAIGLGDWGDLDGTVDIVQSALRDNDLCGTLAVTVMGSGCVTTSSAR